MQRIWEGVFGVVSKTKWGWQLVLEPRFWHERNQNVSPAESPILGDSWISFLARNFSHYTVINICKGRWNRIYLLYEPHLYWGKWLNPSWTSLGKMRDAGSWNVLQSWTIKPWRVQGCRRTPRKTETRGQTQLGISVSSSRFCFSLCIGPLLFHYRWASFRWQETLLSTFPEFCILQLLCWWWINFL